MNTPHENRTPGQPADSVTNYCSQCGSELMADAKFCHQCGQSTNTRDSLKNIKLGQASDQEEVLWEGGYSWKAMVMPWIVGVIMTIVLAVASFILSLASPYQYALLAVIVLLWLYLLGIYCYRTLSVRYRLTNQRFIHENGILVRHTHRIEVIDIDDVSYRQGIIERLLNVGTVIVHSSDRTDPTLGIEGIDQAKEVARIMDEWRDRVERIRRGLHIEAV